jgi:carbon storage regulator CsrA
MLVLSRRLNEKVLLPEVDVAVEVLGVKNGAVRLGFTAPPQLTVLRAELPPRPGSPPRADANHEARNRLNALQVGLALLRRQAERGLVGAMAATLDRLEQELELMRRATPPAPPAPRRRKALLVEDNPNECELLAGFLRLAGVDVATAGDGADALDHLRGDGRPDVVLLDMMMPPCDGPATVRAIRGDPAQAGLKIFAVSGRRPEHFDLEQGPGGVDRWFAKPLDPEAFLHELQRELPAG